MLRFAQRWLCHSYLVYMKVTVYKIPLNQQIYLKMFEIEEIHIFEFLSVIIEVGRIFMEIIILEKKMSMNL